MHQKISTFCGVQKKTDAGLVKCMKSGVRHGVNEIFALLGCYAMLVGSYQCFMTTLPAPSWHLKMGPIGCPKISVTTCLHYITAQ